MSAKTDKDRSSAGRAEEAAVSLGRFLFDSLKREGVTEIFGVPGDYNFTLLDELERCEGMRFIGGRNELNAGYAADSYARLRGLGALITTFGVGEMSAANAVAGAYSESVPLVHIVGTPKSAAQRERRLMHHSLLDGDYEVFRRAYGEITAYTAVLTPENAAAEIPKAIRTAKEKKKPVYLAVAIDLVDRPVVVQAHGEPEPKLQRRTDPAVLEAASAHAKRLLGAAGRAVILSDLPVQRFGLGEPVQRLAEALNVPAASTMLGKGSFDEGHPNYIGVYGGEFGSEDVRSIVEEAGCLIAVGLVRSDGNLANFTAKLDTAQLIEIQPDSVRIGEALYPGIRAEEMLRALEESGFRGGELPRVRHPYDEPAGGPGDAVTAKTYLPRFQRMLKEGDVVVVETGTLAYGMSEVRLPKGAAYIHQGAWQSIGYALPAAFGAAVADPQRRIVLFTGDGALQLTVQEISSMLACGGRLILFVLNNRGYTIEKYLNVRTERQPYNDIPEWSYTRLAEAFGGEAYTARVRTNGELDAAMAEAEAQCGRRLCLIELVPEDPMDAPPYLKRKRSYLEAQEAQRAKG
ncbi:Thiamine pyrophosphate protein TPP binding domain-containing protein [Paenibacillus mucilaginosus 3016]|uniref:Alpha-keto-acid decarboxylase n=1 Tax=Paenibacillus mucilaginosus 3016 TaxID=1116391 RepID=H6NDK2_9BACL|nr:thiamine pyrophosphate-binding protein [Paenibacillus mucilaginosus]AFC31342.1 Thiamine pyrophosphate protein TPP binding domain-containing protein [Paenibacillus mucilaginosus 3016]WFA19904.1 alpha-keto acid decarboxylase family protein [Paenibacillus mucilaginosus]